MPNCVVTIICIRSLLNWYHAQCQCAFHHLQRVTQTVFSRLWLSRKAHHWFTILLMHTQVSCWCNTTCDWFLDDLKIECISNVSIALLKCTRCFYITQCKFWTLHECCYRRLKHDVVIKIPDMIINSVGKCDTPKNFSILLINETILFLWHFWTHTRNMRTNVFTQLMRFGFPHLPQC